MTPLAGVTDAVLRFERLFPRRMPVRAVLGYVVYTVALFLCFLVYTFPVGVIADRLVNRAALDSGWTIRYQGVRLIPWAGFRFLDVKFEPPAKQTTPAIHFDRLTVRPSLQTFIGRGFRRANFRGEGYGGTISGAVSWDSVPSLSLQWDVDLADAPVLAALLAGDWTGRFSGEGSVRGRDFPAAFDGNGRFSLRNVALTRGNAAGFKIPDLHFNQGGGEFEIKSGNVEVRGWKLAGPEVDVELRGQVALVRPLMQSLVNAHIAVRPVPGVFPEIENALRLLNGNRPPQNGLYSYVVTGPLRAPRAQ
ncbi:MAG: type II secretion system protein GspN [Candidatus Binatia bacterium]